MVNGVNRRNFVVGCGAMLAGWPVGAKAENWPSKPVRIICAYPAGGITDLFARAYGEYIQTKSGHAVVVENRTGGGGAVAAIALKSAPADAHTLMITVSTTLLGNRVINKNLPYDAEKDFSHLALLSTGHLPLVAHKSTGANNIEEFVKYARTAKVSFGSYAAGSLAHIVCMELNKIYGLDMVVVNYRGEAPMWQDMHAGAVQIAMGSYQAASSVLETGTGRAIAVPTAKRMRKLPDVPTFAEQGLTDKAFQLMSWVGFLGQAGMPDAMVKSISDLLVEAGKSERVQKLLDAFGVDDAAVGSQAFKEILAQQGPIWIELVEKLGVTGDK
jgi:tripartite-type tricarboxylate transporter receptor subunit TctC